MSSPIEIYDETGTQRLKGTQRPAGGGSLPLGTRSMFTSSVELVEQPNPGTYLATCALPPGSILLGALVSTADPANTNAWACDNAVITVSDDDPAFSGEGPILDLIDLARVAFGASEVDGSLFAPGFAQSAELWLGKDVPGGSDGGWRLYLPGATVTVQVVSGAVVSPVVPVGDTLATIVYLAASAVAFSPVVFTP